jgi:hypothetical protein
MADGVLGKQTETGKYEGNDIPGADDESIAYDAAHYKFDCTIGTPTISGPNGTVTFFEEDHSKPPQISDEHGPVTVVKENETLCIIIPWRRVVIQPGTLIIFDWYDVSCLLDSVVMIKERARQPYSQRRETPMKPIKRCETDIPALIFRKVLDLISKGISPSEILKALGGLIAMRGTGGPIDVATVADHRLVVAKLGGKPPKKKGGGKKKDHG